MNYELKIAVCLKQVPDTAAMQLDPVTHTLRRDGVKAVLNPLDEFPLEAAIRLKRAVGGSVTAFTMGPPQADAVLRRAISMGADAGVLLSCREFAGSDTWATSLNLAAALRKHGPFDVILCGKQATDGDTAQIGPAIAAHLDMPQVTYVTAIAAKEDGRLEVRRMMDDGTAVLSFRPPVVLTVLKEANEPSFPSLSGYVTALDADVIVETAESLGIAAADTGLKGSPTRVAKVSVPEISRKRCLVKGDLGECAARLLEEIKL